jgi:pimeloyl-ACP methyl ester carboxylesterase
MTERTVWRRVRDEKGVALEALNHARFRRNLDALPRGDGHTVMVIPAFSVSDRATKPMRSVLDALGYAAVGWDQGSNSGITDEAVALVVQRARDLADSSGRAISIVGWSLGGLLARVIGREIPHHVRHVITLGSPYRSAEAAHGLAPPQVRTTSIFSKTDAVVDWRNSCEPDEPGRISIEVSGTHFGLALNRQVLEIVAETLVGPGR